MSLNWADMIRKIVERKELGRSHIGKVNPREYDSRAVGNGYGGS